VEIEANQIVHLAANKYPFKLILKTDLPPPAREEQEEEGIGRKRTAAGELKQKQPPKIDYNHWSHGLLGKYSVYMIRVTSSCELNPICRRFNTGTNYF